MRLTEREIATIRAALSAWQDELLEGMDWIAEIYDFREHSPLSSEEVESLRERLKVKGETVTSFHAPATWELLIPTYVGLQNARKHEHQTFSDFAPPHVPVVIHQGDGIRLVLGTKGDDDNSKPDVKIERRPHGWAIFLHRPAH